MDCCSIACDNGIFFTRWRLTTFWRRWRRTRSLCPRTTLWLEACAAAWACEWEQSYYIRDTFTYHAFSSSLAWDSSSLYFYRLLSSSPRRYIDDVGLSVYRRVVQRLAQQGKLAIVFSDHSLAYGNILEHNYHFFPCFFSLFFSLLRVHFHDMLN